MGCLLVSVPDPPEPSLDGPGEDMLDDCNGCEQGNSGYRLAKDFWSERDGIWKEMAERKYFLNNRQLSCVCWPSPLRKGQLPLHRSKQHTLATKTLEMITHSAFPSAHLKKHSSENPFSCNPVHLSRKSSCLLNISFKETFQLPTVLQLRCLSLSDLVWTSQIVQSRKRSSELFCCKPDCLSRKSSCLPEISSKDTIGLLNHLAALLSLSFKTRLNFSPPARPRISSI